jgi:two-component system KDP operon response regulator KdpE
LSAPHHRREGLVYFRFRLVSLRRIDPEPEQSLIETGEPSVDLAARTVALGGEEVLSDPDRVRSPRAAGAQSRVADDLPGPAGGCVGVGYGNDTQVLRARIARLRRKIELDGGAGGHRYMGTDPGVGYRFAG